MTKNMASGVTHDNCHMAIIIVKATSVEYHIAPLMELQCTGSLLPLCISIRITHSFF
jgi:hypothetical protein